MDVPDPVARFGQWFSRLAGELPIQRGGTPVRVADDLAALEAALHDLERVALAPEGGSSEASPSGGVDGRERDRAERCLANERALRSDILALHLRLGTGLAEEHLAPLACLLRAHGTPPSGISPASLADRIGEHVLLHLYRKSGERAWERLEELMARGGVTWPEPPGLELGRTGPQVAHLRDRLIQEGRRAFLESPASRTADLLGGRVAVWADYYPEPGGALWRGTILRGVGSALWGVHFAAAVEAWLWRGPELEERLHDLVREQVEAARRVTLLPAPSLAAAVRVADALERFCRETLPRAVWQTVGEPLAWTEGPPGGLDVGTLWERAGARDPVCGMSLSSDRVAERASWGGRTWFFCDASCRDRFLASPDSYMDAF